MPEPKPPVDRRGFIRAGATAGAATAAVSLSAAHYTRAAAGAGSAFRVALLGCGARAQAHADAVSRLSREGEPVTIAGVCDVWEGWEDEYAHEFPSGRVTRRRYSQGLFPTARRCGLSPGDRERVTRDYRRLLDRTDIDAVVIATPDHWHARMAVDALAAGKHVFCESPLTRTADEAAQVRDAARTSVRTLAVCVPSLADPGIEAVREWVRRGRLGPVVHAQAGVHRNDIRGMWRFYRTVPAMTPETIDWPAFLGVPAAEAIPFDRALFAQWRTSSRFGNGPLSDLLIHPLTRLLAATGLRQVRRVTAGGGLFHETDGRDVPDVVTVLADFAEGCSLSLTATTVSGYPQQEVVRGRFGTAVFGRGEVTLFADDPARGSPFPPRLEAALPGGESLTYAPERNETLALWRDFLACATGGRASPLCGADSGALAAAIVWAGHEALRTGSARLWEGGGSRPSEKIR